MRFGSLFAGIGGMDLGLERAGMTCEWQVETDPFCNRVLEKHWPNVRRYGDVRAIGKHNLVPVSLICGGPPCQPHSVAGKRRGAADDRDLWPEFLRVVTELKPTWTLFENVPGIKSIGVPIGLSHVVSRAIARLEDGDEYVALFTQQERMYLNIVCEDLEAIGYQVVPLIIPAAAFGAPHLRYRVFVVAHSDDGGHGQLLQPERESGGQETPHAGGNGKVQPLADANETRLAQRQGKRGDTPAQQSSVVGGSSKSANVADAPRQLCDGSNDNQQSRPPDRHPNLETALKKRDPSVVGSVLNPTWVELLMGFPPGWTDV